jgi:hypothetical protein
MKGARGVEGYLHARICCQKESLGSCSMRKKREGTNEGGGDEQGHCWPPPFRLYVSDGFFFSVTKGQPQRSCRAGPGSPCPALRGSERGTSPRGRARRRARCSSGPSPVRGPGKAPERARWKKNCRTCQQK